MLTCLQGCVFLTAKGLRFTYKIKGGEMFINRKAKSITQATVFMAFWKAAELGGEVAGPKKLGTFGASYLYPVFVRIGVIGRSHAGDPAAANNLQNIRQIILTALRPDGKMDI